jgi:CheY-like chemotaxis protein
MNKANDYNLTILLAEDDEGHASLVRKNLWRICVEDRIIHFSDGQKLLDYLFAKSGGTENFEKGKYIILLDLKMPVCNGIDTLLRLKKDSQLKKIPVIMLTTTNNPGEINLCYELGCFSYIIKPTNYNKFMEMLEHLGVFISLPNLTIPIISPVECHIS